MFFDNMSFGGAVAYVQFVSACTTLLWLLLPVAAIISIKRRRRNRPGETLLFPGLVLAAWVVMLCWVVWYFFTGAWYGENGPPPQAVALKATFPLLVVIALHVALILTARERP